MGPSPFDALPERYEQWFATPIGALVKSAELALVLDFLRPVPGERILDAGCGTGVFSRPLLDAGARLVGVDISLPMLQRALAVLPGSGFSAAAADIRALPFADGAFDKTLSVTALEFIDEGGVALAEMLRVTRRGGRLVVATLNSLSPWAHRRRRAAALDRDSIFNRARFRSPAELRALSPGLQRLATAVHFPKDADPARAACSERAGRAAGLLTGAFLIGCWRKP